MLREISHLRGHSGAVQVGLFNATGSYALTGGVDRVICLWNPYRPPYNSATEDTGALLLKRYRGHNMDVRDLAVARDSSRIASVGGDRFAVLWDVESGEILRKVYGHESSLSSVRFGGSENDGESVLITGGDDMCVRISDLRSAPTRGPITVLKGFRDKITGVEALGGCLLVSSMDGTVRTWDTRAAKVTCDMLPSGGEGVNSIPPPITALAIPPSDFLPATALGGGGAGSNVYLAGTTRGGGGLCLVDRPTSTVLSVCAGHTNEQYRLHPTMLPGHRWVACGGEDGGIYLWDLLLGGDTSKAASPESRPEAHRRVVSYVDSKESVAAANVMGGGVHFSSVLLSSSHDSTSKVWGVVM